MNDHCHITVLLMPPYTKICIAKKNLVTQNNVIRVYRDKDNGLHVFSFEVCAVLSESFSFYVYVVRNNDIQIFLWYLAKNWYLSLFSTLWKPLILFLLDEQLTLRTTWITWIEFILNSKLLIGHTPRHCEKCQLSILHTIISFKPKHIVIANINIK